MTQTTAPAPLARTTTEAVVASSLNRLEEKFPSQNFSVVDLCISPSSARLIDTLQQDLVAAKAQLANEQRAGQCGEEQERGRTPRWQAEHRRAPLGQKIDEFEAEQHSIDEAKRRVSRGADTAHAGRQILAQLCAHVDEHMVKLRDAFARIDSDGNRALDRSEWARFLAETDCDVPGEAGGMLRSPTDAEMDASWSLLDGDGDGVITLEEFLSAVKAQQSQLRKQQQQQQQAVAPPISGPHAPAGSASTSSHHLRRRRLRAEQLHEIENSIAASAVSGTIWVPTKKVVGALERWLVENAELCAYLPPQTVREIVEECDPLVVPRGQPLLRYGEIVAGVVVLIKGSASAYLPLSQQLQALDANAPVRASVVEEKRLDVPSGPDPLQRVRTVLATQGAAKRWLRKSRRGCGSAPSEPDDTAAAARPAGGVRPARGAGSRRNATSAGAGGMAMAGSGGSLVQMYELTFGSGEMLGEQRAFHNVDAAAVKRHGMMTVSATVNATEDCLGVAIRKPEHIVALRAAFARSQEFKVGFLQSTPHYKHCSEASLARIARTLRRRTYRAGATLVRQGELGNRVFFCVAGKLQVTQAPEASSASSSSSSSSSSPAGVESTSMKSETPLAVLGAHSCFGDWAVLATAVEDGSTDAEGVAAGSRLRRRRAATLRCLSDCELLEMDGYNFLRTVEPRVQAALRHKQVLVESGELSLAAATQAVDDELRRSGHAASSERGLYGIIRKPKKGSVAAAVAMGDMDPAAAVGQALASWQPPAAGSGSARGGMLLSDTAAQFFATKPQQHHQAPASLPSPPMTTRPHKLHARRRIEADSSTTSGLTRQRSNSCPRLPLCPSPPATKMRESSHDGRCYRGARGRGHQALLRQRSRSAPGSAEGQPAFPPLAIPDQSAR
jgi:CRP-like cAMP-binding protein/Ca2+-binding EF-hand superfamily protein